MIKDKEYHRRNSKKNYDLNKKISNLYKHGQALDGESYTEFKNRIKGKKKSPTF